MGAGQLVASLYGLLSLDDRLTPGLKQAAGNLEKFGGNTESVTGKIAALASAMQAVPAAGFLAAAIAQSAQFDKTMTNIGAVMGKTRGEIGDLSQEVLNIGRNSVAGPQAAAEAFYDIVGGVSDASTHMAILNAAIATSEAGAANLQSTTSGLISVMNSYKFSAEKASFVSDVLTQTVGKGVGTMDQFVAAIGPIAGTSAAAGVQFQEMASALAYMTTRGTSAAQAATQFKAAEVALLNPNAALQAAIRKTGAASGSALIQQYGLVGALNLLRKASGGSMDAMAKMMGSVEALQAATALTGEGFQEFAENFENGLNGATEAARKIQLSSFSAQFEIFKNNLIGVAIAAGNVLLPALGAVFSIINKLIGLVNQFDPNLLGLVAAFTALGVAIPALLPLLGMLAGAIAPILVPIAALTGAFAAVKLAWETDFGGIRTAITGFWNDIQPTLGQIKAGVDTFFNVLNGPEDRSIDKLTALHEGVSNSVEKLPFGERLKAAVEQAWPIIQPAIQTLIDKFVNLMKTLIPNVISALVGLGQQLFSAIGSQLAQINWLGLAAELWVKAQALGKGIVDNIGAALSGIATDIGNKLSGINALDIAAQAGQLLRKALDFGGQLLANILSGLTNLYTDLTKKLSEINAVDIGVQAAELLGKALKFGADLIGKLVEGLTGGGEKVKGQISTETGGVDLIAIGGKLLEAAFNFSVTLIGKLIEGLVGFGGKIISELSQQFSQVDLLAQGKKLLDDALNAGSRIITNLLNGLSNLGTDMLNKVSGAFAGVDILAEGKNLLDDALKLGGDLVNKAVSAVGALGNDLGNAIAKNLSAIDVGAAAKSLLDGALKIGSDLIGKALSGIAALGHDFGFAIQDNFGSIDLFAAAKTLLNNALKIGGDLINGIISGLKGLGDKIINFIKDELGKVVNGVKDTAENIGKGIAQFLGIGGGDKQPAQAPATANQPVPGGVGTAANVNPANAKPLNLDIVPNREKGTATNPLIVQPVAPTGAQAGVQPGQPGAPTAPAAPPAPLAGAAGGLNPMDITLQSVQQKLQEAIQWINTVGAAMLTEAMTSASMTAANAFKAGMVGIPQAVVMPVSMANLWVGTVGLAGAVAVFSALSKSAAGALTGIAAPIVSQVAEALIRIATMIAALPNGVGAQLAGQIRAAAGARAEGGPVGPGLWLVGEKGPELLMLGGGQHGQVISNKALRGMSGSGSGGTTIILQNPQFHGVNDPEQLLNQLQQVAGRYNLTLGTP